MDQSPLTISIVINVISIVLNVILGVCVFFKSALNDIAKACWQNRLKRKNERNQRIINLRKHVYEIRRLASTVFVYMAMWINEEDADKKAKYKKLFDDTLQMSKDSIRTIRDDMVYYPDDLKSALERYFADHQQFSGEIVQEPIYQERLLEITDHIDSSLDNIIEMIDERRYKLI